MFQNILRKYRRVSSRWSQCFHYLFYRRSFRRNGLPTALNEIPCIVFHSRRPIWAHTIHDKSNDLKVVFIMKRNVIEECLCRSLLNELVKSGKNSNALNNKCHQKQICQFPLFYFYSERHGIHRGIRASHTRCTFQIVQAQRNLKKL
jgi:hypothetical protein